MVDVPEYEIKPVHAVYSDDAVMAVGEIFLAAASAEHSLMILLAKLQCHPNEVTLNAVLVLTGMQNKVMLQKLEEALKIVAPEHADELGKLCTKIRRIFEHRNNLAHSTAITGSGDSFRLSILKLGKRDQNYTTKEIRAYAAKLYQLVRHLSERLNEIGVRRFEELPEPVRAGLGHLPHQDQKPTD